MNKKISLITLHRLSLIYDFLNSLEDENNCITSKRIGDRLNISFDTVKKDISAFGESGKTASGYNIKKLKDFLAENLKFNKEVRLCIIGLGKTGTFLLNYEKLNSSNFKIAAAFDKSINKLETINTKIELFPIYDMEKIIKEKNINFAVIAVPKSSAQNICDRLIDSGIKGILNFSHFFLKKKNKNVIIHNIDFAHEINKIIAESMFNSNLALRR